ncbi:hypothetical protein M9H77_07134 [Catharanthus roseus]|uniref:Uncharacterized protein n=1 Tax=Catharanthus roseus TaxID=4058 RepID=A0ACC0BUB0_CATRO|nr:hypothetical protein M9H77_07134 [Catharanthus roseus]
MSPHGVAKVETLKPSMIEEFSKVNELPKAQEVVEEMNPYVCRILKIQARMKMLFLESYFSHVSIYGDLSAIPFDGGLFLVVSYASTCLPSHAFLEDSLLHNDSMFDPSCDDFGVMNNASIQSIVIVFGLDSALFEILHECLGKFVENVGYVSSFLDTFVEDRNDFVSLNQLMSFFHSSLLRRVPEFHPRTVCESGVFEFWLSIFLGPSALTVKEMKWEEEHGECQWMEKLMQRRCGAKKRASLRMRESGRSEEKHVKIEGSGVNSWQNLASIL